MINLALVYFALHNKDNFYARLKEAMVAFFLSLVIAAWISVAMGWHGAYSYHQSILLMPLAAFFSITTVIHSSFKEYKNIPLFVFAIAGLVCMCIRTSPLLGKWILVTAITIIVYLWLSITKKNFFKMLAIILLIAAIIAYGNYFLINNTLLQYKIEQSLSVLSASDGSWLNNMAISPKIRIEEFVNIVIEYLDKPWFAIFGKGIGGTIVQHTNWVNWNANIGAFSIAQRQSGIYNELHESVNILFLKFGILGLAFFISNFIRAVKNIKKSPWILMGVLWFTFFVNAYVSMYIIAAAFLLGMYESDVADGLVQNPNDR